MLIPDTTRALAYKDAYGLVLLVLFLLARPQASFRRKESPILRGTLGSARFWVPLAIFAAVLGLPLLRPEQYWL